jgi:hypothetical protein
MPTQASMTMVEWPSENHSPTVCPSAPRCACVRTTLSIAAIWSASTAWRRPNTQASKAVPNSAGWPAKADQAQSQAAALAKAREAKRRLLFL